MTRAAERATIVAPVMIPERTVMQHLNSLLSSSSPGDALHHLHVVAAAPGAVGPLGFPDGEQLKSTIYAIAPDRSISVEEHITKALMVAAVEHRKAGTTILFAGLSQEVLVVNPMDDLARQLAQQRRLREHPNAAEATLVYGAAHDGRRWRGRRWLTGPKAGTTEDVDLLVGSPHPHEGGAVTTAPLIRRLVGITE